jgi:hypothetical protein
MDAVCCMTFKLDLQATEASWSSRMNLQYALVIHHMFLYRITDCSGATLSLYDMTLHRRSLGTGDSSPSFPEIDTISLMSGESSCEQWHEHGIAHLFITECILYVTLIYSRDMVPLPLALT